MNTDSGIFKDPLDGKVYKTVKIGNQVWMAENLNVSRYCNGDPILNVQDNDEWGKVTTGAWCYYDNDVKHEKIYGKLYNWNAIKDPRGLAPEGWHIPSDAEWKELEAFLGMNDSEVGYKGWRGKDQGSKLKETGAAYWHKPNENASNESSFSARPGGYRDVEGYFFVMGNAGYWWSSTEKLAYFAWYRSLYHTSEKIHRSTSYEGDAFSIRCVRDS